MKKENKLIQYIKKILYVILSFLQSLFKTNKKLSIKEEKQIRQERTKETIKKTNEEVSIVTTMPDDSKEQSLLPFENEFIKLFDKQIEEITGIKKRNATYNELYEMDKIRKKLIPFLYQLERWNEEEMERWIRKAIIKEIMENKSFPLKENLLPEWIKEQKIVQEKEVEEKSRKEVPVPRNKEQLSTTADVEEAEKVIDVKEVTLKYEEQPQLHQEIKEEATQEIGLTKTEGIFEPERKEITIEEQELVEQEQKEVEQVTEKEIEIVLGNQEKQKDTPPIVQEEQKIERENLLPHIKRHQEQIISLERKIKSALESELDIEEYEFLQEEIEALQIEISTFIRVMDLNEEELEMTKEHQNRLRQLKEEMTQQEEKEKEEEKSIKEEEISNEEAAKINSILQEIYLEHENDLKEMNLNKVEDLQNKTEKEIKEIEKNLLLLKLSKASKLVGIPTLTLLPFVRNPYYASFAASVFLNNHLHLVDSLYNRKTKEYTPINFNPIKNGGIALDQSIAVTEDNLIRVNQIKQQYLIKYPELSDNYTFTKSIGKLEANLNTQYNKLLKKKNRFSKTKKKAIKVNKRAIKRKILQNEKTEERNF